LIKGAGNETSSKSHFHLSDDCGADGMFNWGQHFCINNHVAKFHCAFASRDQYNRQLSESDINQFGYSSPELNRYGDGRKQPAE
jgi:hypothetical protein